ncbi:M24 family metallopeptidase [Natrarchaeobius chitinivorans]|uniref:Aminopeptidase P family protein n=1 Tax=Natrarchaeobius chitinivorans TaxID=1679083 RepID=A0A3N6LL52_NATCH|nr:Xaa-Pro peptidase family protein [Natrarchaeobius chitinivorans]RQG89653.1 aminopeptidase P family protein [Natrarchaeobius chitinivorans]
MSYREAALNEYGAELSVPFPLSEYEDRLSRAVAEMEDRGIDLLYCTSPESIFYFTGYQNEWYQEQSPGRMAPVMGVAISREDEELIQFEKQTEELLVKYTSIASDVRIWEGDLGPVEYLIDQLGSEGWLSGTVGFEQRHYRPTPHWSRKMETAFESEGCTVTDATDVGRVLREDKSPLELSYVRKAGRIADVGLQAALEFIEPGVTELEIKGEIERAMYEAGGEHSAIPTHVATGARVSSLHSLAGRNSVMHGDLISIDLCGVYNRYHANLARMISVGEPDEPVAEMIDTAAGGITLLEDLAEPSVHTDEINPELESYYRDAGIWEDRWFTGGYELGISFPPDWVGHYVYGPDEDLEMEFSPGTTVQYESNFYLPRGSGMCGLIDTFVYDEEGADRLSDFSPELLVLE